MQGKIPAVVLLAATVLCSGASGEAPFVYIDSLASGATVAGTITISGWAIDSRNSIGTAIGNVQILVDGTPAGMATYGMSRADVCTAYPGRPGCPNVGFTFQLNTSLLNHGTHTISAVATDTDSPADSGSYAVPVTVATITPFVYIDSLSPGASVLGTVTVSGWAIDSTTGIGTVIGSVQISVDGTVVGNATYGMSRPDVCTVFPGRPGCPNVGFSYQLNAAALSPGTHTITATATDSDSTPDSGAYSVSVKVLQAQLPAVYIDSLSSGATISGTVTVSGWAIDNATAIGTAISSVQISVDGTPAGNATYGVNRSDVCTVFPGRSGCPNVGFTYQLNTTALSAGNHTIMATATDSDSTPDSGSYSVSVKVPSQANPFFISGPSTCQQAQVCTYTASGGQAPYTYSMVSGSVGSISNSGAYTAPAHVAPKQVINGCQGLPNNHIFNTRIDNLPVHPNNALWMSNIDQGLNVFLAGQRISGSTVLSTDPSVPMNFVYSANPPGGTNFIFQPFPDRVSQSGAARTPPGFIPSVDNHFLTTYRDTCQQQEVYQYYQTGAYVAYPASNSAAGVLFSLETHQLPATGTDAAGLPIAPLSVHQDELLAAAAGNLDAIQHAARFTLDSLSIAADRAVWPAQTVTLGDFCQGPATTQGFTWTITGNGSSTVTTTAGNGFKPGWPSGMTITIDSINYTVVSVSSDGLSMVVSAPISAGSHTMTTPERNCPPYGTRFRLKANFQWSGYLPNCDTACQNVVQAVIRQQQRYGVILADAGTSWGFEADGGATAYSIGIAAEQLSCTIIGGCGFMGLLGNASNYEIVDESSLQTSQNQGAPVSTWGEAKLGNPYLTPQDAAVVKVTDANSAAAYFSVALQGVAVGTDHPNEVVMAGASPFPIRAWVTGTSDPNYSCTLSPSGGAYGTITSGCVYTPPSTAAVTTLTNTTVTVTAEADNSAAKTVIIQIIPVSSDGALHISLGKTSGVPYPIYPNFTDNAGVVWWNDMTEGRPINLFPDGLSSAGLAYQPTWSNYPGTNAYALQAPQIYQVWMGAYNDLHFRIHVPNGQVTGTVLPANGGAPSEGIAGFSFDCNGAQAVGQTDVFDFTGGLYIGRPLTCTQTVNDSLLHMVVRLQGVSPGVHELCSGTCYLPTSLGVGNLVAGLVVTPGAGSTAAH